MYIQLPKKPNNETITEITNFDSEKVVGLYAKKQRQRQQNMLFMQ